MQRQPLLIDVSKLVSMASSFLEYKVSLGTILAAGTAAGGLAYLYTVANRNADSERTNTRKRKMKARILVWT